MSKWHKVIIHEEYFKEMITEIEDFLHELNPNGRRKIKMFEYKNKYYCCLKFKDEAAAMAFKLRWT